MVAVKEAAADFLSAAIDRLSLTTAVELYWIPLGAGGHSVRFNGKVYEAISARVARQPRCDIYHSALTIRVPDGFFTVEMTPVPNRRGAGTRCRRRGFGRYPMGGTVPNPPLRGAVLARWRHPRSRVCAVATRASHRRSSGRGASPRGAPRRSDLGLGSRRDARRGDVELQLDHLVDPHTSRARHGHDRPPRRRTSTRLGRGHHDRAPLSPRIVLHG
jgi:hypothetical protein